MGKRKSDEQGPSTGERVHMWLSSAKILYGLVIPLLAGMSAYGTSDTVRSTVNRAIGITPAPVASGEVVAPVADADWDAWRATVDQSINSIIAKQQKIESASHGGDEKLRQYVDDLLNWRQEIR